MSSEYVTASDASPVLTAAPVLTTAPSSNWIIWIVVAIVVIVLVAVGIFLFMRRKDNNGVSQLRVTSSTSPTGSQTYTATWSPPTNTGSARLPLNYRYTVTSPSGTAVQNGNTAQTSFTIDTTALTSGTTYTVGVIACGSDGLYCSSQVNTTFTYSLPTPKVLDITLMPNSNRWTVLTEATFDIPVTSVAESIVVNGSTVGSGTAITAYMCAPSSATTPTKMLCAFNMQSISYKANSRYIMHASAANGPVTMSVVQASNQLQHWTYDATTSTIVEPRMNLVLTLGRLIPVSSNPTMPSWAVVASTRGTVPQNLFFRYNADDGSFTAYPTTTFTPPNIIGTLRAQVGTGVNSPPLTVIPVDASIPSEQFQFDLNTIPAEATEMSVTVIGHNAAGAGPMTSKSFPLPAAPTNTGPVGNLTVRSS